MYEKPQYESSYPKQRSLPPVISSLAIISLVFALISPVVLCTCGLSLVTSLIAIVTGHVALLRIRNSAGEFVGRGMAIAGLAIGYLMFGVSIAFLILFLPAVKEGYLKNRQAREHLRRSSPLNPARFPGSESPPGSSPTVMDDVPVTREIVQEFPNMGWTVNSLAFAPDGNWLAAGKLDRTVSILDVQTGATLSSQEDLNQLSAVEQVAFSPDGQFVTAGGSSGAVIRWAIDRAGTLSDAQAVTRHGRSVQSLAVSPAAPFLLTGSSEGELIWQSMSSPDSTARMRSALPRAAMAVYLPKTGLEAMATDGSTLIHVDLEASKVIARREFPRSAVQSATFSSDGGKLAVTAGYKIQVWDTATGASLRTLTADHEMQWTAAFLPDGRRLISGGRGFATLWNLETGTAEYRFDLGGILYIQTLTISPDATLLAAIPASAGQTLSVLRIPE